VKYVSRSRTLRSEAFLWPRINLEDLQQRHLLLLFFNSRGRSLPEVHRAADFHAARLSADFQSALSFGGGDVDFCCASHFLENNPIEEPVMIFQDKCSPLKYGTVVEPANLKLVKKLKFKHVRTAAEGLVSLEIQHGIYRFLLACAKSILHDIEPVMFFKAPHQKEPEMPVPRTTQWQMVTTHALESAYKNPQKLNLERLKMLVQGRRAAAEDHVYSLKEDPGYFNDAVREWREHSDELTRERACHCRACAKRIAPRVAQHAYTSFVVWDNIWRKLELMPSMDRQMARANEKRVRLADQDAVKWSALHSIAHALLQLDIAVLASGVPNSPRLRNSSQMIKNKDGVEDWVCEDEPLTVELMLTCSI
jgi:hypothetical protein